MAMHANALAQNNHADSPDNDIVIKLKAISPITQNTLFSSKITQFYETAATATINGDDVGYGWLEQMMK